MALEFLKPVGDFQYSINLEFDLMNDDKVKAFIPTSGSLSFFDEILNSVLNNNDTSENSKKANRARLLTGAYGKGKSHLTLTLLAFLSGRDKKLFTNLLNKSKVYDENLYKNLNLYIKSKKKLLPIVINTSSGSLKTNFANSLNIALKDNGLEELMPSTYFDMAIDTIHNWQKNYPQTYISFEKYIGCSGEKVVRELENYNQEIYNNFVSLYPVLTSGSVFNPMIGADIVKIYETVIKSIKSAGYSGIFVVYDEFGKFLEGNSDAKSLTEDIKLLQDLAELSERTKFDEQFNLLLISHKSIDNYVNHLSKEKIDKWKGIEGRFNRIEIDNKEEEIYDLIASVLYKKEEEFKAFCKKNKASFKMLNSIVSDEERNTTAHLTGAFNDIVKNIGVEFVEKSYPLHPYSLLMLPKVSELVAQNERSIFTFLASNDKNSVNYFIKRSTDAFPLIEPDVIYDYFEALFKGEPYGSPIREQWEIATSAIAKLSSCENDLAIKIVKTTTLIYIINQFETLPPSSDLIYEIYKLHPYVDVASAFELLRKEELLIELEFKPYIRIRKSSNNNIQEVVDNEISIINNCDYKKILMDNLASRYVYPVDYNDEKEVVRYFEYIFLTLTELSAITDMDKFTDMIKADGLIVSVLVNSEDELRLALKRAKELKSNRVIFAIPRQPKNINNHLKKYQAISNLLDKKSNDTLLVDELAYIQQDIYELITDYLNKNYLKPELKQVQYIYKGEEVNVNRRRDMSMLMSKICSEVYYKTPIIINENINKNNISTVMNAARKKIIEGVLSSTLSANFNLVGSQYINVARSLYYVTGLIQDLEHPVIDYDNCDGLVKNVLDEIEHFFDQSSDAKQSFSIIYNILKNPKYGYGMKDGVIPFFMAVIIRKYKKGLVIYYKNKEQEINADLLLAINSNPALYEIKIEKLGVEDEQYLTQLLAIFNNYTRTVDMELSRFDYIVKAMQRWYMQLPKYNRENKQYINEKLELVKFDKEVIKFKASLGNPEINPREFLFEKIKKITGLTNLLEIGSFIAATKQKIDSNISNLIKKTINYLKKKLKSNNKASLNSALRDYYDSLKAETRSHVFNNVANSFLESIREANNNDENTVRNMLRRMFSLRIEDFTDVLVENIEPSIDDAIKIINQYDSDVNNIDSENRYVVTFVGDDGSLKELHFDKIKEKSYQADMFYNDIRSTIDDFNESLSNAEKGQILLEILKEICK